MTIKLSLAAVVSFAAIGAFAAQRGGGGGGGGDPADAGLAADRAIAEQRVADPTDAGKKLTPDEQKKAQAQKKADLAEYKGLVKDNLANIKALFQTAEQFWKAKEYHKAGQYYKAVSTATVPGAQEMVDTSLQRINSDMENLANDAIHAADDADLQRDFMKEIDQLAFVIKELDITRAKQDASQKLTSLKTKPAVAGFVEYAQAEQMLTDGKLTEAMTALNAIVANQRYEHTIPALKAARKIDELSKNEDTRARLKSEFTAKADKDAPNLLIQAKNYARNSMPKKAKEQLEIVLDKYPGTAYAEEAQKQLDDLPSK